MTIVLNPMINGRTGLPYNAHNDFVRVFFEGGALGLVSYVVYGVLLCKWALQKARHAPVHQAPRSNAVVASLLAMLFLTGGATEFGLQTAILCELYGMLALFNAMDSSWE